MTTKWVISIILVSTFFIAFLGMTMISDYICTKNGFYAEGKQDEIGLYE